MFCAESLHKDHNCYFWSWSKVPLLALEYSEAENSSRNKEYCKNKGFLKFTMMGALDGLIPTAFHHLKRLNDIRRIIN